MKDVPHVAVAGLGGFAADHHRAVAALEREGHCRLVATCDPNVTLREQHAREGLAIYSNLIELLANQEVDVVTLPLPIPLHASAHLAAVHAGAAVYLEKPPSLWWPEFLGMVQTDREADSATNVGFNFVADPFRRQLKERILTDEFGPVLEVSLHAVWPRDAAYYTRNDWAGRLRVNGRWVVDSCIGNALAHYVQNLLFWAGQWRVENIAEIVEVSAWLARKRPIESFDTALVEAQLEGGVRLRMAATHVEAPFAERETVVLERARIVFDRWNVARIEHAGGRIETLSSSFEDHAALLRHNLMEYLAYVQGRRPRPVTTLEDSRSFAQLCCLALVSSEAIYDIQDLPHMARFLETGAWPDESPATVTPGDLTRLEQVASRP